MPSELVLRTPDSRFADIVDFPFEPHYLEFAEPDLGALRMHYLDEGGAGRPVVLMLHGEPSLFFKSLPSIILAS